ncbi:MAG: TrkA family potassium uptake protein [Thermoanaerobaculales bacterium]|jgi:trk system potassium uptake protein TrkA|nr:TrkA family potassium uptake protein [Thermoanaerobaculales bacterium]
MRSQRYAVVVGCGRLGARLANHLSRDGDSVVAIDTGESAFDKLSPDFSGFRLQGDATLMAVLREARLDKADILVATTREDNVNLMVAQVAREIFGVQRVLARLFDPKREAAYERLGIETICPTTLASEAFLRAIEGPFGSRKEGRS